MSEKLISDYLENNSTVLLQEFRTNLVPDIKKRKQDVEAKLKKWFCAFKDIDARKRKESSVHNLERDIRYLIFRLENVLETYVNVDQPRRGRDIIRKFIDDFKSFRMVDLEVKEINIQIKRTITNLITVLALIKTEEERSHSVNENPENENRQKLRKSISDDQTNHIVGMDHELENLTSYLRDGKNRDICIYGRGGIGKTTLAHKLYKDLNVEEQFYICSAVEIGQNPVGTVLGRILKQLPRGKERIESLESDPTLETVTEHFNKYAKSKKYLFVLDDIQSLDDWNFFHRIFPNEQNGSKLILTTRSSEVASYVAGNGGLVHEMQPLSPYNSFKLFKKAIPSYHFGFLGYTRRGLVGRRICIMCEGLPSAIIAVSEVLTNKRTTNEWETLLKDVSLLISRGLPVEQIALQKSISDLSFEKLPYHLKLCFLYLGLFPKGSKIEVEHLYLQWMAEGMISLNDCQNNVTMMDLAERYLSELVGKQMVEVEEEETPSLKKYKSCWVQEHMQDYCLMKGEEYFFKVLHLGKQDNFGLRTQRRTDSDSFPSASIPARGISLHIGKQDDRSSVDQFRNEKVNHLRSLLLLNPQDLQMKLEWPRRMFNLKKYRMLRVLKFERLDFQKRGLPRGMIWPIYLKYLSFKGSLLEVLPSSIGNLSILEILDLRVSNRIIIPNVLWKLGKLVYLYLPLEFQMPSNDKLYLGSLKDLEILENFDTGVCNVSDLFEMMSLRHLSTTVEGILGDLEQIIHRMDKTSGDTSVLYPSIKVKNFDCYTEERHSVFRKLLNCPILHTMHMEGHLGQLSPYYRITRSLTEMVLIGSQLEEDPMTTLDQLPKLLVLVLQDNAFAGKKMICVKSSFKQLKRLEFSTLTFLETWEVEEKSMPKLSILAVKNCRKLISLPDELRKRVPSITFENDN